MSTKILKLLAPALILWMQATLVSAGGLLGDAIDTVCGSCGLGKALDDAHGQLKDRLPIYKSIEEGASKTVNESLVQSTAPILQELIIRSKEDALNSGVMPIPEEIKKNLRDFISENILNIARYRIKGGGDLSLQVNSIKYGEAQAITLDYVIVFKEQRDALYNPTLWAHELVHVQQYKEWGIKDFAIRYIRDHRSVEAVAYDAETRYIAWVAVKNARPWQSSNESIPSSALNHPISPFQIDSTSSMCGTAVTTCQVNTSAPIGTPCWCNTPLGAATGSLIPSDSPTKNPEILSSNLPSGTGMQVCGCWGPNPTMNATEPRCESGSVRLNICPGFCAPGHPLYAYVCN